MKKLFSLFVGFIAFLTITSCGNGISKEGKSQSDSPKTLFSCILYEDNNGELKNAEGERVCAVNAYSRGEPLHLYFSTQIKWEGLELNDIYLKNGKVYTDYPSSSKIDELIPLATYNMSSNGSEMSFVFYPLSNIEELKQIAEEKKKEREENEKLLEQQRQEELKRRGPEWLQGRWIHSDIDVTHYTMYYEIFDFSNGYYRFVQSEDEYAIPRGKSYGYYIENDIIYKSDDNAPILKIDTTNKKLTRYNSSSIFIKQ